MDVKKNDVSGKGGREVAAAEACERPWRQYLPRKKAQSFGLTKHELNERA